MRATIFAILAGCLLVSSSAGAQSPLTACANQFIGGTISNAPTIGGTAPEEPYRTNKHLCYRDDDNSFFAIEYWPEQFAPRWAAYKLSPANYGPKGCNTFTRDKANCYIKERSWNEFQACKKGSDPFHGDHMLGGTILGTSDFGNTGHDRGHIAPRQAFSWHVCGTYQTFTMANMSPQRAFLNQDIWQYLEQQVLTWGVDEGPIYVVTGTTFRRFPHQSFQVYTDGTFDPGQIYQTNTTMLTAVEQHHANFAAAQNGDILRPKRDANPTKVAAKVEQQRMPTGYYKVIFRPAVGSEPAHAIGFLLPHTFENLNDVPGLGDTDAFWAFISRIDLIEATSGTTFPGIPSSLKSVWGDQFFLSRNTGRNIRDDSCGTGSPKGVLQNSTNVERLAACIDQLQ